METVKQALELGIAGPVELVMQPATYKKSGIGGNIMTSGRLLQITSELKNLGYYDFQIKDMVEECLGRRDLDVIEPEEEQLLIGFLEERLNFAMKCLEIE